MKLLPNIDNISVDNLIVLYNLENIAVFLYWLCVG